MERSDIDWRAATALKGAGRRAGSNRMRSMRLCLRCAKLSAGSCLLSPDSLPFHLCASAPLRENPPRWTRHGTGICLARSSLLSPVSWLLTSAFSPLRLGASAREPSAKGPAWEQHLRCAKLSAVSCLLSPVSCLLTLCLFTSAPLRLCGRSLRHRSGMGRTSAQREALCCLLFPVS